VALIAGAARSRFVSFVIAITLGQALWIGLTVYVGDALARWTDLFTTFLGEHLLESTLVCIALVTLQRMLSRSATVPSEPPSSGLTDPSNEAAGPGLPEQQDETSVRMDDKMRRSRSRSRSVRLDKYVRTRQTVASQSIAITFSPPR
jgi:hypothetical protein